MATLITLPAELVAYIAEFTDPASHIDLICTCSSVAGALRGIIKRHRAAAAQPSDLLPNTIPDLLRNIWTDPIAAYHVRSIRIWSARSTWADWRPTDLSDIRYSDDRFEKQPALNWSFAHGEVEDYLRVAAQYLDDFDEGSYLRENAHGELADGDDGFAKALLMVMCPRLDSVYYARGVNGEALDGNTIESRSLYWLCEFIMSCRGRDVVCWPPGLQSLRRLAIGVETGTWLDRPENPDCYEPEFLAKILNLPNLESLYLYALSQQDADGEETFPIEAGCASLRHLFLDEINEVDTETWSKLMEACKDQLTSLAFRGGAHSNMDNLVELARENCHNLQSLMVYGSEGSDLGGYRCGLFYPEVLGGYHSGVDLRNVTLVASDLALGSMFHSDKERYPDPRERFVRYVMPHGDDPPLPSTLEVLVFVGDFAYLSSFLSDGGTEPAHVADWFDDALAAMICGRVEICDDEETDGDEAGEEGEEEGDGHEKSETDGETELEPADRASQDFEPHEVSGGEDEDQDAGHQAPYVYPNLRVIYIDPWPGTPRHDLADERGPRLWLQKSIQAAHERCIEVRSRVNINDYRQPIDLHIPPDRYDMRPDISPPDNETFGPIRGEWIEPGCGNCGTCPPCLELFTEEAWACAYRAPSTERDGSTVNDERPDDEIPNEIWTRILEQTDENTFQEGYYIQPLQEYRRNRRCEGEKVCDRPDGAFPTIGFPMTRRKQLNRQ